MKRADPNGEWVVCGLCPLDKKLKMRRPFCTGNWIEHVNKRANHVRHGLKGAQLITSFFAKRSSPTVLPQSVSSTGALPAIVVRDAPPIPPTKPKCQGAVPINLSAKKLELLQLLPTYGNPSKLVGLEVIQSSDSARPRIHSVDCLKTLTPSTRQGNKNLPGCCKNVSPCSSS